MIIMTMATAMSLAGLQASITAPRIAFSKCIEQAQAKARTDKVATDAYAEYLRTACGAQGEKLKAALIAFDVKNGIKRGQAAADASRDVTDGFTSSAESYKWATSAEAKPAEAN